MSWLKRFFDSRAGNTGPAGGSAESLRDLMRRGAGLRPFEAGDLPGDFLARLHLVFRAHANVQAAWIAWLTWPSAPRELLVTLELANEDAGAIQAFVASVDALGGPRCLATQAGPTPTSTPFYERSALPTPTQQMEPGCPHCGHAIGNHVLSARVSHEQLVAADDGSTYVNPSEVAGPMWLQCPVPGCKCMLPVRVDSADLD